MMGSYGFLRSEAAPDEVIVIDEGFVHRAVQLHASAVESPTGSRLAEYVAVLPRPDLVVHVHASSAACWGRVHARGAWARLSHRSPAEIERFVQHAHETVTLLRAELERQGWPVLEVDNDNEDPSEAAAALTRALPPLLLARPRPGGSVEMTPPGGWIALPKPSLVTGWVAARVHAPRISEADAAQVVAMYGAQLIGKPANLSQTWRNHVVVVRTSAGRKVLKEYRETSTRETIAHEHSIIDHLEACDFPATRLDHTPTGSSVVEVDDRLFASFDFEPGRNLTSTIRSSRAVASSSSSPAAPLPGCTTTSATSSPPGATTWALTPTRGTESEISRGT